MEGQLYCDTHLPATPTKSKMEDKARKPTVSNKHSPLSYYITFNVLVKVKCHN